MNSDLQARQRLSEWLKTQLPDEDNVRIDGLDHLQVGHSAETISLTIASGEPNATNRRRVVLRMRPRPPALLEPYDLTRQFEILEALQRTPVRTPHPLWLEASGDVLGRPFFVMEHLDGTVYELTAPEGPNATTERLHGMCQSMAEQLAAIHTVDLHRTGLERLDNGQDHLRRELRRWGGELLRVRRGPLPALELLMHELTNTTPPQCPQITLVHGDPKPGNFAFVDENVSAVFDWELTTVGDPLTDIGWMELLWMQPVGLTSHPSAPTIEQFLAIYQAASGITLANRPWYRALNAFKMAVICLIGAKLLEDGVTNDERFITNASGIALLTELGLADLNIDERPDTGPVMPSDERIEQIRMQAGDPLRRQHTEPKQTQPADMHRRRPR
ncbi:MAG: phosphotransferase family protein [Mycobacterium sp.]|uniref:phosphotransferase family protein n=1 Tax=Mycobacterium sp. TaxID=1785 RepID=UPI001ECB2F3A|nr:phosphotransferase family protein [Mycobacterium sp.]MBW0018067.1 phosphotransferase family protein [Mycobacterium sp.]